MVQGAARAHLALATKARMISQYLPPLLSPLPPTSRNTLSMFSRSWLNQTRVNLRHCLCTSCSVTGSPLSCRRCLPLCLSVCVSLPCARSLSLPSSPRSLLRWGGGALARGKKAVGGSHMTCRGGEKDQPSEARVDKTCGGEATQGSVPAAARKQIIEMCLR